MPIATPDRDPKSIKQRKKKFVRDSEAQEESKCTAEWVRVDGENVLVDERSDIIAHINGRRGIEKIGRWVADWAGCDGIKGVGVQALTKAEVIEKMRGLIARKKEFRGLCEDIWKKRYGK